MRYARALLIDPDTDGGVPVDAAIDGDGDKIKIACGGRRGFIIQMKNADLLAEMTGIEFAGAVSGEVVQAESKNEFLKSARQDESQNEFSKSSRHPDSQNENSESSQQKPGRANGEDG